MPSSRLRKSSPADCAYDGGMQKLVWFVVGVAAGFVAAHFVDRDPRGHVALATLDARMNEFADRVGDAYRDQQERLAAAEPSVGSAD